MKKIFFIFMALTLLFVSASLASATVYYSETWTDGTTRYQEVTAGEPISFIYESYDHEGTHWVETDINLLFRGEADEPVANLLNNASATGTSGVYIINTTNLVQGHYIIQGTAYDLVTGANWTSLLEFFVYSNKTDTDNSPPHFSPIEEFTFDIAQVTEANVLEVADYARDPDNDTLTYTIDKSGMNETVLDCDLYNDSRGTLACEFYAVGRTYVTLIANDGEFPTPVQVFINVINSGGEENHAPRFTDDLELFYTYNIDLAEVDVVDLADFAIDEDNDSLLFQLSQPYTNTNIVDCELVGSVVHCNLNGVGETQVDVLVSDGRLSDKATLYITVYNDTPQNHLPEFRNLQDNFTIYLEDGFTELVLLSDHGYDEDGDVLAYSLVSNSNNAVAVCDVESNSLFSCTPYSLGYTDAVVQVSDGKSVTTAHIRVTVQTRGFENHAPRFTLESNYTLILEDGTIDVVNLDSITEDPDGDTRYYTLVDNSNTSVVDCSISPLTNMLVCTPLAVGQSYLKIEVSDGDLVATGTIGITVLSSIAKNHPPQLLNVPAYFVYNYSYNELKTVIPDVTVHGYDVDGDTLTYSIDTTATDTHVVDCNLVANALRCTIRGEGTTTVALVVSDGEFEARAIITIEVISTILGPVAVIQGPTTVKTFETFTFDAGASTADPSKQLIKYQWTIRNAHGQIVKMLYGAEISSLLSETGVYTVTLLVVDEDGRTDEATVPLTVTKGSNNSKEWVSSRNLQVNSIQIVGSAYETAVVGDDIHIYVTITNGVGYDLDNIRATCTIPEFGVRFKSKTTAIDDGEKVTLDIFGYVPTDINAGVYYPEISVDAGNFHRAKIGYLEVTEN